ncbi:hypothetical protein [Streptomyces sp. IBSBF 3136]|uniref:hypothetical protein n=1 Tax=Streptomyces sp. IBSBF 3136 TaxID=2903524 RepID=UPI002FDC7844
MRARSFLLVLCLLVCGIAAYAAVVLLAHAVPEAELREAARWMAREAAKGAARAAVKHYAQRWLRARSGNSTGDDLPQR